MKKRIKIPYGKCNQCSYYGEFDLEDESIGQNEYWGSPGFHEAFIPECPECGSRDLQILGYEEED